MPSDLKDEFWLAVGDLQGIQDGRELIIELDIHDGTNDRNDSALWGGACCLFGLGCCRVILGSMECSGGGGGGFGGVLPE
jgi:hypothetical protein